MHSRCVVSGLCHAGTAGAQTRCWWNDGWKLKSVVGIFSFWFTLRLLRCSVFSCSLIDRRGYIQPDTPQPAAPSNGMAAYGATQSQSDMVGPGRPARAPFPHRGSLTRSGRSPRQLPRTRMAQGGKGSLKWRQCPPKGQPTCSGPGLGVGLCRAVWEEHSHNIASRDVLDWKAPSPRARLLPRARQSCPSRMGLWRVPKCPAVPLPRSMPTPSPPL